MAHIIRKSITTTRNGQKITAKSNYYYGKYKDENDIWREKKLFKDKLASEQMFAKIVKKVELTKAGIFDRFEKDRQKALTEHLEDFKQNLLNKGNTVKHVNLTYNRAKKIVDGCKFKFINDIKASAVEHYLADRKRQGLSIQSSNFYLQSIKQFCHWLVSDQRTGDNPIQHLKGQNTNTDRRHDRRALELDEIEKLLRAVRCSSKSHNMTVKQREALYTLALSTGLRASELARLRWSSLNLSQSEPLLVLRAAYSKRKKEDTLPLRADIAKLFADWKTEINANDEDKIFPSFNPKRGASMIRKDLQVANIEYIDSSGRVADFHSLRHTFITILTRSGVSPRVVQSLARHSTISLTMDRYSHINLTNEREALEALPDLTNDKPESQVALKTGTDDLPLATEKTDTKTDAKTAQTAYLTLQSMSDKVSKNDKGGDISASASQVSNALPVNNLDTSGQSLSEHCAVKNGEGGIRTRGRGVYPYDGLANRCLKPLGHLSE